MEIKDGRIHYRLLNGGGETVTLLCGHMRSLRDFTSIARFLQAENFQVLLLDNRGSGATECSLDFSLAQMAHDVRNLWRHLGIASSHVVGFSMGGVIAQEVLRQNSMGVASLAMVSSLSLSRLGEVFSESHWESWPSDFSVLERRLRNYVGPQFLEENSAVIRGMARQIVKEIETTFQGGRRRSVAPCVRAHAFGCSRRLPPVCPPPYSMARWIVSLPPERLRC